MPRLTGLDIDVAGLARNPRSALHVFRRHRVGVVNTLAIESAGIAGHRLKLEHPSVTMGGGGSFEID